MPSGKSQAKANISAIRLEQRHCGQYSRNQAAFNRVEPSRRRSPGRQRSRLNVREAVHYYVIGVSQAMLRGSRSRVWQPARKQAPRELTLLDCCSFSQYPDRLTH